MTAPARPTVWRIRGRAGFDDLRRRGRRRRSGPLQVIFVASSTENPPRVAYAVGRRVGSSVVRNRVRRRLRAVVAQLAASGRLMSGDYLVVASPAAAQADFATLRDRLAAVCTELGRVPA